MLHASESCCQLIFIFLSGRILRCIPLGRPTIRQASRSLVRGAIHHLLEVATDSLPPGEAPMRLVLAIVASVAIGGCAVLAGAGLGGAGGFLVAGPPGAVVGAGAGAVGGAVGSSMRR